MDDLKGLTELEGLSDRILAPVTLVLAVAIGVWVVTYAYQALLPQRQHANLVLGAALGVFYFNRARQLLDRDEHTLRSRANAVFVLFLGVVSLVAAGYVHVSFFRWLESGRMLVYSNVDLLVGVTLIYLVTDATFREYGTVLGLVIVGTMLYGLLGPYMPGLLGHAGLTVEELIRRQTITMTGIYGFLLQVGATWIAIFVIFAGLVEEYGGFEYLIELSMSIKEHSRSGIAQTAVITSMFMGTMMGASASNVATTGSFTIPLMKEHGIPSRFAGATEAVASTGGQILPPIMGTAAFLMADIIGVPFAEIVVAGVLPALLFYGATALSVHFTVVGRGWYDDIDEDEADVDAVDAPTSTFRFVIRGLQYLVPLIVLIYALVGLRFGPLSAGLYTVGAVILTRGVRKLYARDLVGFARETVAGLRRGGANLAAFMTILGSLGIVINIFSVTGLAQRIAFNLVDVTGGYVVLVVLVAMIVSLLLGLGMPTPAAYVLVATILAPVLTQVGFGDLQSHFFIFYFALLSALTPPVALAVTIAIGISGSDFVETAKQALVLGAPTYVIPFMFLAHPELLRWTFPETAVVTLFFAIATLALVVSLTGFIGTRTLSLPERVLGFGFFLVTGFAPVISVQFVAAIAFLVLLAYSSNTQFGKHIRRRAT